MNGRATGRDRRGAILFIGMLWLALGLLYSLPYFLREGLVQPDIAAGHFIVSLAGFGLSLLLFWGIPWIVRLPGWRKYALFLAEIVLTAAAMAGFDIRMFDALAGWLGGVPSEAPFRVRFAANFAVFMSQFALIGAIGWLLEVQAARRRGREALADARAAALEAKASEAAARLAALRYQLNPHFLFNALNSISSLVMIRRAEEAEEMLTRLSEFLRRSLSDDSGAAQSLGEEFEMITAYLELEAVRFGDRLTTEVICPGELREARVPGYMLQPLVENAIKYGVRRKKGAAMVRIEARREDDGLVIEVVDRGETALGDAKVESLGIGHRNVQERLAALYGGEGRLELEPRPNGYLARVRLPLDFDSARRAA